MIDIIEWLEGIEQTAADLYRDAAGAFREDATFRDFLLRLAAEESEHRRLLTAAADLRGREHLGEAPFVVDRKFRAAIEAPFARARQRFGSGELTRRDMLEMVVDTEFSEWNEIFLYVIDTLKGAGRDQQRAAAEIELHRWEIENFLRDLPEGGRCLERMRSLPALWKERVLVIEDDHAVARLLESLLRENGEVVLARDGEEGLARIREGHFDAIISDVSMPNMDGITLYRRALALDPDLKRRFIFFTASREDEHEAFFRDAGVVKLGKPTKLSFIRQTVAAVVHGTPAH